MREAEKEIPQVGEVLSVVWGGKMQIAKITRITKSGNVYAAKYIGANNKAYSNKSCRLMKSVLGVWALYE